MRCVASPCRLAWLCAAVLTAAGCENEPQSQFGGPVFVVQVEQLAKPQIPAARVFRPSFQFAFDPQGNPGAQASAFFLTVASGQPDDLAVRLRRSTHNTVGSVQRVPPPGDPRTGQAEESWTLEPVVLDLLNAGTAAFWVQNGASGLNHRLAILLPDALWTPTVTLEVYEQSTPDGSVIGGDRIELAADFFYVAAIGDSAMWGNGLRTQDKFITHVARIIEQEVGARVIMQHLAVSGARILPHPLDGNCARLCQGEVPKAITAVQIQADLIQEPQLMDLVLLNGCANDVGLSNILSTSEDPTELTNLTRTFCGEEMEQLIHKVRAVAPQAPLVVTGYGLVVSRLSDLSDLQGWITTLNTPLVVSEDIAQLIDVLAANSKTFERESRSAIIAAVDAVNTSEGSSRIAFADPGYQPQNAAFGPDPWMWGLTDVSDITLTLDLDLEFRLFPEDPLLDERLEACARPGVFPDLLSCLYSSVAHPNRAGAQAYTTAIVAALRELGVLPPIVNP